jgi:signal peptidase II
MIKELANLKKLKSKQVISIVLLSLFFLALDQLSKLAVINAYKNGYDSIEVLPFFNITFIINYGISFSLFNGLDYRILLLSSIIALICAVIIVINLVENLGYLQLLTISLLIGGALGNIVDRYVYQGVVDFLHFYYDKFHFPIFNLADCFVSMAGAILFFEMFIKNTKKNLDNIKK